MNLKPWMIAVLALVSLDSNGGTGIKNGGTALDCGEFGIVMAESILAMRRPTLPDLEDRERFFRQATARVNDPVFLSLLRARWDAYGDSEHWPVENPSERNVYWYTYDYSLERFDAGASIAAVAPDDPICGYPAYEPELCCPRILVSYFDRDARMPMKVPNHYDRLTRVQKNVLELHEAVYRTAADLAKISPPMPLRPAIAGEIGRYLRSEGVTGELPSVPVVRLIASWLTASDHPEMQQMDADQHLEALWHWSRSVYGSSVSR